MQNQNRCCMCQQLSQITCSGCQAVRYCSAECQRADEAAHRLLCGSFAAFHASNRPTTGGTRFVRGIVFPENQNAPHFVWLKRDSVGVDFDQLRSIMRNTATTVPVSSNERINRQNIPELFIWCNDHFMTDGSSQNQSVSTAIRPQTKHYWRGNVLVTRSINGNHFPDVELSDFRNAIDSLATYAEDVPQRRQKVAGVRINCLGDRVVNGKPTFRLVQVPDSHPVFHSPNLGGSAPYAADRYSPDPAWLSATDLTPFGNRQPHSNPEGSRLLQRLSTNVQGTGMPGSILVVRRNRAAINLNAIQALCTPQPATVQPASHQS